MIRILAPWARIVLTTLILFFTCACLLTAQNKPSGELSTMQLRVMTYNLKFASDQSPNTWGVRRPVLKETIKKGCPDLIGTQEGVYDQLKDLDADLPGYAWIGQGREGGSKGEFSAIFYRADRFEPLAFDNFWLSDTPEIVASRTWGNNCVRMVTWVRFLDRESGREFYFWNTHFDHEIERARRKSARLMIDRIRGLSPALPVIVTGDFNALPDSEPYKILVGNDEDGSLNLIDTWQSAAQPVSENYSTFHGWREPDTEGNRIDWILTTPDWLCDRIEVDFYKDGDQWPSDHFPVISDLRLAPPALAGGEATTPAS